MTGKLEMPHELSDIPEGLLLPTLYVDLYAEPVSLNQFSHNYPPVSIPLSKEKHPILLKLGALCHSLLKIHPIHVIWAPSSLMKTHRSLSYQISRDSTWKGRHYTYTTSMWEPQVCRTQWYGWRRVGERKRRCNSWGGKRKELLNSIHIIYEADELI